MLLITIPAISAKPSVLQVSSLLQMFSLKFNEIVQKLYKNCTRENLDTKHTLLLRQQHHGDLDEFHFLDLHVFAIDKSFLKLY